MRKKRTGFAVLLLISMSCCLTACGTASANSQSVPGELTNTPETTTAGVAQTYVEQNSAPQKQVSYKEYEAFGLQYDESKDELYFDGELVRYFYDGVDLSDGAASVYCDYLNEKGTVDIYTIREQVVKDDGSEDPFGKLAGIERYSQEEFDNRDLSDFYGPSNAVTYVTGYFDPTAESFTDRFAKYKEFGIEYVEAEDASGAGNIYYNGNLVNNFLDISPNGGTFSFHSADGGKINVQTIYENEKVVGVEEVK